MLRPRYITTMNMLTCDCLKNAKVPSSLLRTLAHSLKVVPVVKRSSITRMLRPPTLRACMKKLEIQPRPYRSRSLRERSLMVPKAFSTVISPSGLMRQQVAGESMLRARRNSRSTPFFSRLSHILCKRISRDLSPSVANGSKLVGTIPQTSTPPRSRNLRMEPAYEEKISPLEYTSNESTSRSSPRRRSQSGLPQR